MFNFLFAVYQSYVQLKHSFMVYNPCLLPISKLIKLPTHDTTCNDFHVKVKAKALIGVMWKSL